MQHTIVIKGIVLTMNGWDILAYCCLALVATALLSSLIGTAPSYSFAEKFKDPLHSSDFFWLIEALTDAKLNDRTMVEVLANGENFYPAELEAIRGAEKSVNLEAYIFSKGRVAQSFVDELTKAAKRGVRVNVVIDSLGSFSTREFYFRALIESGGRVERYHPFSLKSLLRMNNRTHRELLIVDGRVGFIGGAGIADQWRYGRPKHRRWRDTMAKFQGDVVSSLQATFAENWCECTGEVLVGSEYWPGDENAGTTCAMVINGSPNASQFTRARVLFQALIANAQHSIHITTPYFLPDESLTEEIVKAKRERSVRLRILVPGDKSDHTLTRTSSRLLYGEFLKAGAEIFEYQAAMIHAKVLIVDGIWSVLGSTNLDSRSFGLNDEVNLAIIDPDIAGELEKHFEADVAQSKQISYEAWKHRGIGERAWEVMGWALRKQQ